MKISLVIKGEEIMYGSRTFVKIVSCLIKLPSLFSKTKLKFANICSEKACSEYQIQDGRQGW